MYIYQDIHTGGGAAVPGERVQRTISLAISLRKARMVRPHVASWDPGPTRSTRTLAPAQRHIQRGSFRVWGTGFRIQRRGFTRRCAVVCVCCTNWSTNAHDAHS